MYSGGVFVLQSIYLRTRRSLSLSRLAKRAHFDYEILITLRPSPRQPFAPGPVLGSAGGRAQVICQRVCDVCVRSGVMLCDDVVHVCACILCIVYVEHRYERNKSLSAIKRDECVSVCFIPSLQTIAAHDQTALCGAQHMQ